ncbi:tricarboxylate transporter [bacterium]|mgnify:FL=1|jgi:tripartite-type tricarboxylate transporter receptor subunit TctC|nr:tricarboxylate transporter [Pelagibacterales bacterium]MDC0384940.1 tricarboxylate transporter [bacterium]
MNKKLVSLVAAVFMFATNAGAVDFSGKTVEWLIPFSPGGGSDKWSRFYAPMLSKALPGNPNVVVNNCPGGGGTTCTNKFSTMKNGDGLTIYGDSGSVKFPYLLGDKRVKYEYKDWSKTIVLATPTGGVAYTSSKFYKSKADFKKLQGVSLKFGSNGATSLDLIPLLAFEMLGLQVKPVFGMKGRGPSRVAFERGETTIDYQTTSSYKSKVTPMVKEGKAVPLFTWGVVNSSGVIERDPTFPNLPHWAEYYESVQGKKPSGPAFRVWKAFLTAGFSSQKMVFLPTGTDPAIVKAYRDAFVKVTKSDEFKKTRNKRLGVYNQVTGSGVEGILKAAMIVPADDLKWLKNFVTTKYGVKF